MDHGPLSSQIQAMGISVESLHMDSMWSVFRGMMTLRGKVRHFQPDVVHTMLYHADLIGGLAARMAGVRSIVWGIHSADIYSDNTKALTRRIIYLCALLSPYLPALIGSCSQRGATLHQSIGYAADKMRLLPNGFDTASYHVDPQAAARLRQSLGLSGNSRLVGLVARYHPVKNIQGFIQAASSIQTRNPDVHFVLVGNRLDSDNAELMSWINASPAAAHFHLLGYRRDVPAIIAGLDVMALTSWSEAFPLVVGEAMACGVPCVVTDVGDAGLIVGDCGRIVPAGNMQAMADALLDILQLDSSAASALAQKARQRVIDNFDIERTVDNFENVFEEARLMTLREAKK